MQLPTVQILLYTAAAHCNSGLLRSLLQLCHDLQQDGITAWRPILGDSKEEEFISNRSQDRWVRSMMQDWAPVRGALTFSKLPQVIPGRLMDLMVATANGFFKSFFWLARVLYGKKLTHADLLQQQFGPAPMPKSSRQQQAALRKVRLGLGVQRACTKCWASVCHQ